MKITFEIRICFLLILIFILAPGCEKNPCKELENGIYISPDLPANHNMTGQEVDEFLDMPKEITDCITTDGLIKSILKYPHISLIFAGSNPQSGYILLKSKYSGLVELESRFDGGKYLLEMYRDRDPLGFDKTWELTDIGKYLVTGIYIEVMQSQYYSLNRLNNEDFKNLFMRSLEVYDLEMTEPEYFGYASIKFISTTLARMMLIGRYEPFVSLYNSNQWVLELTEFYNPVDTSTFELIHKKAIEYSKNIKK